MVVGFPTPDPPWVAEARKYIGLREVPGKDTLPQIRTWLLEVGAWWSDDETPWCGTFVNHCIESTRLIGPRQAYRARSWLNWGMVLSQAILGCVAVFDGGPTRPGKGHVGFVVGRDAALNGGNLMVLGGNQGDAVSVMAFARNRVLPGGYRWPIACPLGGHILPLVGSSGRVSRSEG